MTRALAAIAIAATLGLSGAANAVSFTIDPAGGMFSDAARTVLEGEFDVGQTIYGRIALGLEGDDGIDPPGYVPEYGGPMELIGMDFFDDFTGDPVDPVDVLVGGLFTPTPPHSPSVMYLDYTLEFSLAGVFTGIAASSPAIIAADPGFGILESVLDPGPLFFSVSITESTDGVPAPGALALLGLGLLGLGMRRKTA